MIRTEWSTTGALAAYIKAARARTDPVSATRIGFQRDIVRIVTQDHEQKLTQGIDRHGRPQTPLAPSTLATRGSNGPPLLRNRRSWPLRLFQTKWLTSNMDASEQLLVAEYVPDARITQQIIQAHEMGARRGRWRLPARPTQGITPAGFARIAERWKRLARDIIEGGR